MIETKLWKYDRNATDYKGTDYSQYIMAGDSYKEDITDELDTSNITLIGLPTDREFDPQTKFLYQKIQYNELGNIVATNPTNGFISLVVEQDTVEKPIISDDTCFNHHISFIEPSVIAQQRTVDNISATYKLQDVSLEEKASVDSNANAQTDNASSTHNKPYGHAISQIDNSIYYRFGKYFVIGNFSVGANNKLYNEISYGDTITITLPNIAVWVGQGGVAYQQIGYASMDYRIVERNLNDYVTNDNFASGTLLSNSTLAFDNNVLDIPTITLPNGCLPEKLSGGLYDRETHQISNTTIAINKYSSPNTIGAVDLSITANRQITITPNVDRKYEVIVTLHKYTDVIKGSGSLLSQNKYSTQLCDTTLWYELWLNVPTTYRPPQSIVSNMVISATEEQKTATTIFQTYTEDSRKIVYTSATPYSAYQLLSKAILNVGTIKKTTNTPIFDTKTAFYIDPRYISKLQDTQVIENFYNQKNLWEICLDVGKYIHAVPSIVFGEDERLMITFNELGEATESTNNATQMTVTNFRGVSDYIATCDSYISNMVQMGGYIEEWIAPKSTSEDYLVTNSDCCLTTSKPIIEILDLQIKNINSLQLNGQYGQRTISANTSKSLISDLQNPSGYVYEENIYNILNNGYSVVPNKGLSCYYSLGDNKIRGFNYQTPTLNTGERQNDYAIKKIIYTAFYGSIDNVRTGTNYWSDIKINDFVFYIKYRTKDSLRQTQSRPDLRKYLVNSKYDIAPIHSQFNNQEDVVVDSIKFGNNIYGKLIRTGNTNYKCTEWNENIADLKHKGQLYRINETTGMLDAVNGNLYYVATAEHTYYGDCIISVIEYSKDYNQLSQVIGIPSEPRFYEISEQSSIKREKVIDDYKLLTTDTTLGGGSSYWNAMDDIADIILGQNQPYPNIAVTTFKDDADSPTTSGTLYKDVASPISAYSSENTLTLEWDMRDNFSAGDKVVEPDEQPSEVDKAYKTLSAISYTDQYGRADMFDFYIVRDTTLTPAQIQALPECPYRTYYNAHIPMLTANFIKHPTVLPTIAGVTNAIAQAYPQATTSQLYYATVKEQGLTSYWLVWKDNSDNWYKEQTTFEYEYLTKKYLKASGLVTPNIYAQSNKIAVDTDQMRHGIILLKDNRETLSFNFNTQLLTDSDRFVLSPFVFKTQKQNQRIVLLKNEVNKMSSGYINFNDVITPFDNSATPTQLASPYLPCGYLTDTNSTRIYINSLLNSVNIGHFNGNSNFEQVKAIAIVFDMPNLTQIPSNAKFSMARNVTSLATADKTNDWYIVTPDSTKLFTNRQ